MKRLYYTTTTVVHAVVADSPEKACAIADTLAESTLANSDAIVRTGLTAELATAPADTSTPDAMPEWEFPLPEDNYTVNDPDAEAEAIDSHRRWTIAQWVAEQRRLAPAEATPPAVVSVNDDWRGPPSADEVRAHHEATKDIYGASLWHMIADGDGRAVAIKARDGALGFVPHEATRWRPADSRQTPVTWPTPRGER